MIASSSTLHEPPTTSAQQDKETLKMTPKVVALTSPTI